MFKRLFDLVVSLLLLIVTLPVMLLTALSIRLDSPGPIVYRSPRMGRGGKIYGMVRFRTVDITTPDSMAMNERLTRVGRFIRNYSIDDLPSILNVLKGDQSWIGPRPTEPERVDLDDPLWQQILSVRPGMSPAILQLGREYNASPYHLKNQLELEYVQRRSLRYDLQLFWQGVRQHIKTKGNIKHGGSQVEIDYATYQVDKALQAVTKTLFDATPERGSEQLSPDQHQLDIPHFCLFPDDNRPHQPAIILRIATSETPLKSVQVEELAWRVVHTNRYVCLGFTITLRLSTEERQFHLRRCHTVLDVASPEVENWFGAWQTYPETAHLYLLTEKEMPFYARRPLIIQNGNGDKEEQKAAAVREWRAAKAQLQKAGCAIDNFVEERILLLKALANAHQYETVEEAPLQMR